MPAKVITTEKGHSIPPEGPHTITFHVPGWDAFMSFRDGDTSLLKALKSVYPRLQPFGLVAQFTSAVQQKLGLPSTHRAFLFTNSGLFLFAQERVLSDHHKEHQLTPQDLVFKVADVDGVRIYVVGFPVEKIKGIIGLWQDPGVGISSRLAEALLSHVDSLIEVPFPVSGDGDVRPEKVPAPTYLPEVEAHHKLRKRIVDLLTRAPLTPERVKFTPDDVFLYGSGMAAIYRINEAIMKFRRGTVVVLGSIFHNTWHLFEEAPHGLKHFGDCSAKSGVLEKLDRYLQEEEKEGRVVSYVFVEFPSNPILVSVDLKALRDLANKYGFYLVVDDTIGSFCNVDVSSVADVIMTSLTKSFSGYADVMGGSIVLNPDSPRSQPLRDSVKSLFHNEYFSGDADKLLFNSDNYLARSTILNRNASTLAAFLQTQADDPASPVVSVQYSQQSDTLANFQALMRPATPEFTPGYGCLLSVELRDVACAKAFFDNLKFYHTPHLGAHLTLALPFNELVWGKDSKNSDYHAAYGVKREQIRIAVGLESEEELLDTVKEALVFAQEASAKSKAYR